MRSSLHPILVYATAPGEREAERIARDLLKKRFIACANIVRSRSLYHWKGKLTMTSEAVILMKSEKKHFASIVRTVRSLSSYECPCVVAFPIADGFPAYLDWLRRSVL